MTVFPESGAARISNVVPAPPCLPAARRQDETERSNGERRRRQTQRWVLTILGFGVAIMAAFIGAGLAGLRVNLTPSEPLGLWQIVPPARLVAVGDLVFICPPPGALSEFGLARGYFRRGACPGGTVPLLKTVAAVAGASISVGAEVTVDGSPLRRSRLSSKDGQGRALSPWGGGIVPSGQIYLHSEFRSSYDSRYFGPVPDAGLLGFARPLFTVAP